MNWPPGIRIALALVSALTLGSCSEQPPLRAACEPDSIPDAFARPGAALLWPGMPRAFHVDEQGRLGNGLWRVSFTLAGGAPSYPRRIVYEDRWLPVVHWTRHDGAVRWDFEAVAYPARADTDSVLAVSLVAEATNTSTTPQIARIVATLDTLVAPDFVAAEGKAPGPKELRWASGEGRRPACAVTARGARGSEAVRSWSLAPGDRKRARFVFTSHVADARMLGHLRQTPHEKCRRRVRDYWTRQVDAGAAYQLGDPEVEAALRAARVVLLACRERQGGRWMPIGGPFQYRDTWIRDAARLIYGLSVSGYTNEAREAALGLTALQWPNGAFLSQRGQLDGSGQALWAFEQAFLRPPGAADLGELAARAVRCWHWSEAQRDLGRQSGWPLGRLMAFAEPRDNELVRAQLVGNDAWMIAGYAAAARVCGAAGMAEDSVAIAGSREAYLADFRTALEHSRSPDIPPSWQGPGRDWGNLAALWPARVLDPADPRAERLAGRLWAASLSTMLSPATRDSAQSYVGADLGTWALLADRPASADSVLADLLRWRNASGAHAEVFSRSTRDFGANLPPHPTAAAALVSLVRNALIADDRDTLQLTLGARAAWWRGSAVLRAPTRWGVIDLHFEHTASAARWTWTPVPVWTLLRLPPGSTAVAPLEAPLVPGRDAATVLVPPGVERASVRTASRASGGS